jgi:hypothetical protein
MRRLLALVVLTGALGLTAAASSLGDPVNGGSETFTFACSNGFVFTAIGETQAQNTTGHVIRSNTLAISANAIFQVTQITVDGQTVRDLPASPHQATTLSCTVTEINSVPFTDAVVVFTGFLTPAG